MLKQDSGFEARFKHEIRDDDHLTQGVAAELAAVLDDPVVRFAVEHCGARVAAVHRVLGTVDLQAHTTVSDGTVEPEELVRLATASGLQVLAITDHNTIAGLGPALGAAARYGLIVIPGIELSTHQDGHKGLVSTGGSDFHGEVKPNHTLEEVGVPHSCVEGLQDLNLARG